MYITRIIILMILSAFINVYDVILWVILYCISSIIRNNYDATIHFINCDTLHYCGSTIF